MNIRATSEEPVELIAPGRGLIPVNGFQWVSGEHGARRGTAFQNRFLRPIAGGSKIEPLDTEAYLEFAELDSSEESLLGFAIKHGALGCARVHFHLPDNPVAQQSGETITDWLHEAGELRRWFEIWNMIAERKSRALMQHIRADDYFDEYAERAMEGDRLLSSLRSRVVNRINEKMEPSEYHRPDGCFLGQCRRNNIPGSVISERLGGVRYLLEYDRKKSGSTVRSQVQAQRLLSAIWLQFAEYVSGSRTIRRCEAPDCQRWMDISDTARKGAKRLHDRCSTRLRMQRYRQKINGTETEEDGRKK
jgi:hypothetical protein